MSIYILLAGLLSFHVVELASATATQANLNQHKAGLKSTFFNTLAPQDWGRVDDTNDGGPTITGERAVFTGSKFVRYNTTDYQAQTQTVALNDAEDWVVSFTLDITAQGAVDKNIIETSANSGGNIFRIVRSNCAVPDDNSYLLLGGLGGGQAAGWQNLLCFEMDTTLTHELVVHYKASNARMDFYLNGVHALSNFMGRSGNYDINVAHLGDDSPADGDFSIDDLFIGIKVEGQPLGVITTFPDPDGRVNRGVWRLTYDRAIRAEANYHKYQCWSHDGRYTCYTLFPQGPGVNEGQAEVHIVDLLTGVDTLVDTGYNPRWANHSNVLFYAHFFDDFWRLHRYDLSTSNTINLANGLNYIAGGTDYNDEWLFGYLRDYTPEQEWTPVRVRTTLTNSPFVNGIEFMPPMPGGSGSIAVNVSHPVLESRYRNGDPFLGSRATLYDLDGTNERIAILLSEEGHVSWSGGGEYVAVGNQQVAARRWNKPYPNDLEILSNEDTQDISPMDREDRYLTGASLKIFDLRSGDGDGVVSVQSSRIYPGPGDNSTLNDIDPKGSPDGTKVHYHSVRELKDLPSAIIDSFDGGGGVLYVDSTEGWPNSGHLVYRDKEVMAYSSTTDTSFNGIVRAAYYSQLESVVETGAKVLPLSSIILTPSEAALSHPDGIISNQLVTNGDPNATTNPLIYQAQTDCYILVARLPDAPHLRLTNQIVELIPGEQSREIRHYQLLRDGEPYPNTNTFFSVGDAFLITDTGTFDAVSIEWSNLKSPPSNELVLSASNTLQVLTNIPGNFSWTYEQTAGTTNNTLHRHDEEVFDEIISRTFTSGGVFVIEDLDWKGRMTRRQEFNTEGGTLLRREYWRHDGPSNQMTWLISEETFDAGDGFKTVYSRYRNPDSGGSESDRIEYNDGRPTKKYEHGGLIFDYSVLLKTTNSPDAGGSVSRNPDQWGFAIGQVVTLTASSAVNYTFTGWSGDLSGTNNPDSITMSGVSTGAPGVQFDGGFSSPGLNVPLTANIEPVTFGNRFEGSAGDWEFSTNPGRATPSDDGAESAYRTTLTGPGAITALSTHEDWVATITWERNDLGAPSHNVWELENTAGNDIFRWDALGSGNVRMYHNNVVPDPPTFGDYPVAAGNHKLTVHFISAENDFDVWLNDTKIIDGIASELAGGITTGLGLEAMRIRSDANGVSTSRDSFSLALAGQANFASGSASDKTVTANFAFNWDFMLDVVTNPPAGGTVQRNPDQGGYDSNTVVTLTAVPSAGYGFIGWSNDLTGSTNPDNLTMDGNKSVTAIFDLLNHPPTAQDDAYTIVEDSGSIVLNILTNDSTAPDIGETAVIEYLSRVYNVTGQPGMVATMSTNLDPSPFGKRTVGKTSEWAFVTEQGRSVAYNITGLTTRLTYKPTTEIDQTLTAPMATNESWGFDMQYKTDGVFGERNIYRLFTEASGDNVLLLSWVNDELRLTDGLTTTTVGTTNEYPVGIYYHITALYKPTNGLFDFYINDVKLLSDRPLSGAADINRFELRANSDDNNEPTDFYDEVRLGQVAQGTLAVTGGNSVVYTPLPGFSGVDGFTYTMSDGTTGGLVTATVLINVQEDQDGDSLPDVWEQAHGLDHQNSNGVHGASGDLDGDGRSNYEELIAGTDANNSTKHLTITYIGMVSTDTVTVTWTSEQDGTTPTRYYDVFRTPGPLGSNLWVKFAENIAPAGITTSTNDTLAASTQLFYRVHISGF